LFLDLDILPQAKESFDFIMQMGYPVEILTALPRPTCLLSSAACDKIEWVRRHLHPTIQVNCSDGWDKKIHWVAPKHILIDDMERNVHHWVQHGGIGVHHTGDWSVTLHNLNLNILTMNKESS
jgi:hypothetical protein